MTNKFQVWDANDSAGYSSWLKAWETWPEREVGSHPAYANLFRAPGDRALCAAYTTSDNGSVLYPFILREIPRYLVPEDSREILRDTITPYGYGGPHAWGLCDATKASSEFWRRFDKWACENNVVSEFIRFGLFHDSLLPYPGEVVSRSRNIVRSLDLDEDAMFMSFEKKVRKNVRKAERSGLKVEIDEHGTRLNDFLRIYDRTMERRNAGASYRFSPAFFESIHSNLPGCFAYAYVLQDKKVISTELLLISKRVIYSFLGGTDIDFFEVRPNDLLKHEVIRWARARGKASYVLGGGAAPNDGIERYKRSFAPEGEVDFRIGQRILQPDVYRGLVAARIAESLSPDRDRIIESAFFPTYRTPL